VNFISVFRIIKAKYAATAYSGEGSRNNEGRWHHKGYAVVYASKSLALAALETLANFDGFPPHEIKFCSVRADIPQAFIMPLENMPDHWSVKPIPLATQDLGTLWLKNKESAALRVPSVLIHSEYNYLINPQHPDFDKIKIYPEEPFTFDERLNKR